MDICTGEEKKGAAWPRVRLGRGGRDGVEGAMAEWVRALACAGGRYGSGSNPAAENFASELWQFRLPRFASVFMVSKSTPKVRHVSKYSVRCIMTRMWL